MFRTFGGRGESVTVLGEGETEDFGSIRFGGVAVESGDTVSRESFEYSDLRVGRTNGKDDTVRVERDGSVGGTGSGIFRKGASQNGSRFARGRGKVVDRPCSIGLSGSDERVTWVKRDLVDLATEGDVASDAIDRLASRRSPDANGFVEGSGDNEGREPLFGEGGGSSDGGDLLGVSFEGSENL